MKIHRLRFHGIGAPFAHEIVELDLDACGPGLLAIVGGNGEGKTHLLELLGPATLHRRFASYGEPLAAHVPAGVRDAFTELTFSLGATRYTARVTCDPGFSGGRGKSEAVLLDAAGEKIAGPLLADYDQAIARILPSRALYEASVFSAQQARGFFQATKAEREALFVELLDLDQVGRRYAVASEKRRALEQAVEPRRLAYDAARERALKHAYLADEHEQAQEIATEIAERGMAALADRDAACEALQAAVQETERIQDRNTVRARERDRLDLELVVARGAVTRLEQEHETLGEILDQGADIRDAAARLPATLEAELEARRKLDAARATWDAQKTLLREAATAHGTAAAQRARAGDRLDEARRWHTSVTAEHDGTVTAEQACREKRDRLLGELETLEEQDPHLEAAAASEAEVNQAHGELAAAESRAALIEQIPGVPECVTCPLAADAYSAQRQAAELRTSCHGRSVSTDAAAAFMHHRAALVDARAELRNVTDQLERVVAAVAATAAARAELPELEALEAELATLEATERETGSRVEEIGRDADDAEAAFRIAQADAQEAEELATALRSEAAQSGRLDEAQGRRSAILETLTDARKRVERLEAERAEIPADDPLPDVDALVAADTAAAEAAARFETEHAAARQRVAELAGQLAGLAFDETEVDEAQAALLEANASVADWTGLATALGPNGFPKLEMDAAGPAVMALCNHLLDVGTDGRFQVRLDTTAMTKDGKKQREVFVPVLIDTLTGREGDQGSGGEMSIADEAMRMSIARYHRDKSQAMLETLLRDETAAALSPEMANRYVAMLRRALERDGLYQAVLISHSPDIWRQADVRIHVENGTARIDA